MDYFPVTARPHVFDSVHDMQMRCKSLYTVLSVTHTVYGISHMAELTCVLAGGVGRGAALGPHRVLWKHVNNTTVYNQMYQPLKSKKKSFKAMCINNLGSIFKKWD